jgi:arylsulfatase A-like enzyme/Flp pilus assembly protein TadD
LSTSISRGSPPWQNRESAEAGLPRKKSTTPRPAASPAPPRSSRARTVASLVAIATVVSASTLAWRARRTATVTRDPGLSVLLVSVDTLRADALGCYGRAGAATPWADRLAAEGVRFETAHAHNVVTLPSHANLLSGEYPLRHGVRDNTGFRFPPDRPTLATILRERGWRTGAFVSAFPLDSRFGLDRGFETYDDRLGGAETGAAFLVPERRGEESVRAARRWIESVRGQRFFAFVHLYEPHFPYEPKAPLAARFAGEPYQGEVAAADAALGPLLAPIVEAGARARTLVVFTSDHGESLGEHGETTHGVFAYESTLRVPLVLWAPGLFAPAVVRTPVRHVDVLPTLLDAVGLGAPGALPGRSLLPLIAGRGDPPPDSYLEALSASLNRGWAPLHGAIHEGLKYVELPVPELYDLRTDPGEKRNLAAERPAELERLRALVESLRAEDVGVGGRVREEEATLERLRALGYVAGDGAAPKERYTADDDPKALIGIDTRIRDVVTLFRNGDYDGAIALCRETIRRRPDMPLSYLQLAYLERRRGRLDAAILATRQAVDLRPLDAESVSLHAVYLTEAGRPREAIAFLEPYARNVAPDLDVLTALGMAQARAGRRDEALAAFARARLLDPSNAMVLVNVGTVHLMAGDRVRARQAFEAALDLDEGLARPHNSLGVIAAEEGRLPEAIARWRRAAELDPRDYQTLFNLGTTLRRTGREAEARPYLEAYLRAAPLALEARDIARVRAWLARAEGR